MRRSAAARIRTALQVAVLGALAFPLLSSLPDAGAGAQADPSGPDRSRDSVAPPGVPGGGESTTGAGDLVRIRWRTPAGDGWISRRAEGRLERSSPDSVFVHSDDGLHGIPLDRVEGVERGEPRTGWEGFKHGFVVGSLVVGIPAALLGGFEGARCEGDWFCPGPAGGAALLGGMGLAAGGVSLGILRAIWPGTEWTESELRWGDAQLRPGVAPVPTAGGTALGLSVRVSLPRTTPR